MYFQYHSLYIYQLIKIINIKLYIVKKRIYIIMKSENKYSPNCNLFSKQLNLSILVLKNPHSKKLMKLTTKLNQINY